MKYSIRYAAAALAAAGVVGASLALAEDKSESRKPNPEMEEMMKKVQAAGSPGAAHKALEPLLGNWTAEVRCWMTPGAPPSVSKATAKAMWIMSGRFVQEEFNGEFMGKPFRGVSITGYDNLKQKYTTVWMDDMSTSMTTAEGQAENGGKVITLTGKFDCPMTGRKDIAMKQVIRIIGPDSRVFEMHDASKGELSKSMEITYRVAGGGNIAGTRRQ